MWTRASFCTFLSRASSAAALVSCTDAKPARLVGAVPSSAPTSAVSLSASISASPSAAPSVSAAPPTPPPPALAEFPAAPGPSLSGPFWGLRFGMKSDEAKLIAPGLAPAMRVFGSNSESARGEWRSVGPAKMRLRIHDDASGLSMIELVYPDEATALTTLTAAWGRPEEPPSSFRWRFWTNATAGVRATLMPGEGERSNRVELMDYRPLEDFINTELTMHRGRPILGSSRAALADLPTAQTDPTSSDTLFQLRATERSSGHLPYKVYWEKDRVKRVSTQVDYTYDRGVKARVPMLLANRFGAPRVHEKDLGFDIKIACKEYGAAPRVIACDLQQPVPMTQPSTVWSLEVEP